MLKRLLIFCLVVLFFASAAFGQQQLHHYRHAFYSGPLSVLKLRFPGIYLGYERRMDQVGLDVQGHLIRNDLSISHFTKLSGHGAEIGYRQYVRSNPFHEHYIRFMLRYDDTYGQFMTILLTIPLANTIFTSVR